MVPQTAGPVTEIAVENGQHVEPGDLLFRIDDSAQQAALALIAASEARAEDTEVVALSAVESATAQLKRLSDSLSESRILVQRGTGRADEVQRLEASVTSTEADLRAAEAQLDLARIDIAETRPAQRQAAQGVSGSRHRPAWAGRWCQPDRR